MNIAVCDDNLIFLEEFMQILYKSPRIQKVSGFSAPLELIMQVKE